MPTKPKPGRVAAAECIATLLRIYRAAVRAGDAGLRDATAEELRTKYGVVPGSELESEKQKGAEA